MDENTKYQWIKGEKFGTIEIYNSTITDDEVIYMVFNSGRRIATSMIHEFLKKLDGEDSEIDMDLFNTDPITNQAVKKQSTSNDKNKFTIKDLIADQLDKNKNNLTISINVPILKMEHFLFLQESHKDILDDLVNIVIDKYINKTLIKDTITDKIKDYYSVNTDNKKADYITIETEDI